MFKAKKRAMLAVVLALTLMASVCSTAAAATSTTATSTSTAMTTYIVKAGDCLWNLAKKFGVTVQDLVDANNIKNPNLIYVNQALVIPVKGETAQPPQTEKPEEPTQPPQTEKPEEPVPTEPSDFKVIPLGTGAPPPEINRFGPAVLVQVNGQNLLFDAGRGVMQRLYQYGLGAKDIDMVFITHLHSDHTVGLPDLYLTGMLNGAFGLRTTPFKITGIEGTAQMMEYIKLAYSGDINIRMNDGEMTEAQTSIEAHEFNEDGVVYEKDGVTVTAIENFHGEAIDPSYGYRIDYDGRSVVISGDTKYCENIIENSKGVDLLIHSVGMANEDLLNAGTALAEKAQIVLNHHTPPEDAASVFNQTQPKLAVLNHMVVVTIASDKFTPPTQQQVYDRIVDAGYTGDMVIAKDLMIFEIGETIKVIPYEG